MEFAAEGRGGQYIRVIPQLNLVIVTTGGGFQWNEITPLLIPAMFYLMFFVVKWAVLTLPVWWPIIAIIKAMKTKTIVQVKEDKEKE